MADDIIWSLDADGEGTLAVIDQIDASLQALSDSIAMVADSSNDFAALDEAMAELSAMTMQGAEDAAALSESMTEAASTATDTSAQIEGLNSVIASMSETIAEDTAIISGLNEQITNLQAQISALTVDEAEAEASSGMLATALTAIGDAATGTLEGLQSVTGPLLMIGTVASMVGGKIISMGMDGQKGEALLKGMAGASQQDIQALQQDALKLGVNMTDASAGFYEVESAGYAGADAITVFDAATRLAEGGEARQQDVMSGLTAIMHDYNAKADEATKYTDYMAEAIVRGKQSAQDFSSNIGPLAAAAANVGISFDQVAAAEATMTQVNPKVGQDAQQLTQLFNFLSPTMGGVADIAKKLKLSFDEQSYSSLDLIGKLQYLADIAGGTSTKAFEQLTGGARGSKAAITLMQNGASSFIGNLDAMGNSAGAAAHAFDDYETTVPAHLDKAGAAMSLFGTKLMDAIGPKVSPIIDKITSDIGKMSDFILNHMDLVGPVLAGLAAIIGTVLVGAIASLLVAIGPVLAVLLGIGVLVGGIVYAFTHWSQTMGLVNAALKIPAIHEIMVILQSIGSFLAQTFTPVWQTLIGTIQTQLIPTWNNLLATLKPILPTIIQIGEALGGALLLAVGIAIGIISGLVKAFAAALQGAILIFGGLVEIISGALQIIIGLVAFFVDLFSGHFDRLGKDLEVVWNGIITMIKGVWDTFQAIIFTGGAIIFGFISGFISGIIGFFQHLFDMLVGHSIIPDMVNGIVNWFEQLPSRAMGFVNNLVSGITGALSGLASNALTWAGDMIDNFVSGIEDGVGKVGNAISGVANTVKNFLGFSLPEQGPLADADTYMPDFIDLLTHGVTSNQDKLKNAMSGVAAQMAVTVQPGSIAAPLSSSSSGNDQANGLLSQIVQLLTLIMQQGKNGNNGQAPNVTFNSTQAGTVNSYQLNQLIQALSGYGYESVSRGGV